MMLETANTPSRTVYCADAIEWLRNCGELTESSFIVSMPDFSEFPSYSLEQWKEWFIHAATLILSRTPDRGAAIFFQSDIKVDQVWVDKGFLVQQAAACTGHALLFHKIFCRVAAGNPTYGRPGYSHLLAFSKGVRPDLSRGTADVVAELGEKSWVRGMGIQACQIACEFVQTETTSRTIVNPFCGYGSVLAAANAIGLGAIGIERSPKRADRARSLQLQGTGSSAVWV